MAGVGDIPPGRFCYNERPIMIHRDVNLHEQASGLREDTAELS